MIHEFLLPETNVREAGSGPEVDLGEAVHRRLAVTLTITRTSGQQSLDISIWGSPDGIYWGSRPLVKLPHQFYCGTWKTVLDLADGRGIHYLRADWHVSRWRPDGPKPLFTVELMVHDMLPLAASA
ncbi:conserved hypothetical protein [Candidatus Sulfopaludibacter sp. SbA3]|nr:conserved hypothetical protein [Candidatus Sulfopaludibacter sp. SbA3]